MQMHLIFEQKSYWATQPLPLTSICHLCNNQGLSETVVIVIERTVASVRKTLVHQEDRHIHCQQLDHHIEKLVSTVIYSCFHLYMKG